jgi:hypothetical protein
MPDFFDRVAGLCPADCYAALKAEMDRLAKALDIAKADIRATGLPLVTGDHVDIAVCLSERSSIDTAMVRQMLTAEQVRACSKVTLVETLRIKPKVAVPA